MAAPTRVSAFFVAAICAASVCADEGARHARDLLERWPALTISERIAEYLDASEAAVARAPYVLFFRYYRKRDGEVVGAGVVADVRVRNEHLGPVEVHGERVAFRDNPNRLCRSYDPFHGARGVLFEVLGELVEQGVERLRRLLRL